MILETGSVANTDENVGSNPLDMMLTEANADEIFEKLLPAQKESYKLGLKLLPMSEVSRITSANVDEQEKLRQVIATFLRQKEPKPTWREIVEALRSPSVNLPDLATKLERAHCPSLEEQKKGTTAR